MTASRKGQYTARAYWPTARTAAYIYARARWAALGGDEPRQTAHYGKA